MVGEREDRAGGEKPCHAERAIVMAWASTPWMRLRTRTQSCVRPCVGSLTSCGTFRCRPEGRVARPFCGRGGRARLGEGRFPASFPASLSRAQAKTEGRSQAPLGTRATTATAVQLPCYPPFGQARERATLASSRTHRLRPPRKLTHYRRPPASDRSTSVMSVVECLDALR